VPPLTATASASDGPDGRASSVRIDVRFLAGRGGGGGVDMDGRMRHREQGRCDGVESRGTTMEKLRGLQGSIGEVFWGSKFGE
jgi:hypothetical protein